MQDEQTVFVHRFVITRSRTMATLRASCPVWPFSRSLQDAKPVGVRSQTVPVLPTDFELLRHSGVEK
jgi:hypothetical protein